MTEVVCFLHISKKRFFLAFLFFFSSSQFTSFPRKLIILIKETDPTFIFLFMSSFWLFFFSSVLTLIWTFHLGGYFFLLLYRLWLIVISLCLLTCDPLPLFKQDALLANEEREIAVYIFYYFYFNFFQNKISHLQRQDLTPVAPGPEKEGHVFDSAVYISFVFFWVFFFILFGNLFFLNSLKKKKVFILASAV